MKHGQLLVGLLVLAACAAATGGACTPEQQQYAKTANDAAKLACEAYAEQERQKLGLSFEDAADTFCRDLRPWLDAILGANAAVSASRAAGSAKGVDGG